MNRLVSAAVAACGLAALMVCLSPSVSAKEASRKEPRFQDEPATHALYDAMIAAMRAARSLSYESIYTSPGGRQVTYRIWLKKPSPPGRHSLGYEQGHERGTQALKKLGLE